ncbi:MAG TPA: BlaI/MecI/CopY family transcriptional regulator [Tepidisphaeraceae bacterium]|jgi:predicted transcriptional regulator
MPRTPREITDAELGVLRTLWEVGPCTIRQITARLYPANTAACYATVQKLLERLEGKSFVARKRGGTCHTFRACVCREELIARRLRAVAHSLCGGSLAPLLAHLIQSGKLTARERQQILDLLKPT